MQAETLRREWREALGHLLRTSLHDDGSHDVWKAKVDRIERTARRLQIELNPPTE